MCKNIAGKMIINKKYFQIKSKEQLYQLLNTSEVITVEVTIDKERKYLEEIYSDYNWRRGDKIENIKISPIVEGNNYEPIFYDLNFYCNKNKSITSRPCSCC